LSGEAVEVVTKGRIGRPLKKFSTQVITWQPSGAMTVGHDVSNRLTMHGQDNSLTSPYGVDHPARLITKLAHSDLHVRQRSTIARFFKIPVRRPVLAINPGDQLGVTEKTGPHGLD
jgi:hypothetical protein